ncbi:REP-associated tyrosine transposase [Gracilimonas sp.]|uniref:REP-associated tyrosine transposase n=1 Tax=Gracilimonas sp. TaxID=1974203 RepID=UPI003BAD702D
MGRSRYKFHEHGYPYFLTNSVVEGIPLFKEPEIVKIILDGFLFLQRKREVELSAYVIMENHIHYIAKGNNLSEHIRNFKSYSAHQIVKYLKKNRKTRTLRQLKRAKLNHKIQSEYQIWTEGSHPKQLFTYEMMAQKTNYIHYNPVKRGYVDKPEHWRYSSARDYIGMEGMLPITIFAG